MDAFDCVAADTLSRGDAAFIHQHVVDAHAAQTAGPDAKPVAIWFALAGLYLAEERGSSGREVQLIHMSMARAGPPWPIFPLSARRASLTVEDVADVEGPRRDALILQWRREVWDAWAHVHAEVAARLASIIGPNPRSTDARTADTERG